MRRHLATVSAVLLLALAGCAATLPAGEGASELSDRFAAVDLAVDQWRAATDLPEAHRAAEEVRNLIVGQFGPFYGDANGDGTVDGAASEGVLPGTDGQLGLAQGVASACVERDVLGGSWADAAGRWSILQTAIDEWAPSNNTFPALPSHPQRVVGWATLALGATDLTEAVEYAGHADLHVAISIAAVDSCSG